MTDNEQALILLGKIIEQGHEQSVLDRIYGVLRRKVKAVYNQPGGHLVLRSLIDRHEVDRETISLFLMSEIPENIDAGYAALHADGKSPNLMKMPVLLQHLVGPTYKVRAAAARFVREYAA